MTSKLCFCRSHAVLSVILSFPPCCRRGWDTRALSCSCGHPPSNSGRMPNVVIEAARVRHRPNQLLLLHNQELKIKCSRTGGPSTLWADWASPCCPRSLLVCSMSPGVLCESFCAHHSPSYPLSARLSSCHKGVLFAISTSFFSQSYAAWNVRPS